MKVSDVIRILCIILLLFTTTLAKLRKEKDRKKVPSQMPEISDNANLCTIEGNSVPFHCFCSDGIVTTNSTKAKCWVFQGLTQDHNLWTLFSTQPFITELNIMVTQQGQFNFIPTKALQYLKELQSLTIVYGSIDDIHPYAFANLTKVYEIMLTRNRIVTLSHHAFAHLTNLSVLDLDENRISELNRDVFVDLPHLKKLFLKQNNLSVIQEGIFRHLGHLVELELGANSISVLTKDTFAGLGELKKLFLSYNKIIMLGDLTFAELWILEELDLEANQIEFISDRAFAGLTHLWRLNLSYNKLKNLRSTLLDGVPAIVNFDLRHNNLETLTYDNIKPILQNFYNESGYFHIADNNFVCDCRLAWMYLLRNETKNQLIRDTINDLTCHIETDDDDDDELEVLDGEDEPPAVSLFSTKSEVVDNSHLDEDDDDENDAPLNPFNERPVDSDYDEYNENEDDYQQQESLQNKVTISQPRDPTLRRLIQIPLKDLPCVKESKRPTQIPGHFINTPAYAEINANRCSINTFSIILLLHSIIVLLIYCT